MLVFVALPQCRGMLISIHCHYPLRRPTPNPALKETDLVQSSFSNTCQIAGELCFNRGGYDIFCCSTKCGSNGRCESINSSNSNNNSKPAVPNPTRMPSRKPSNAPTPKPSTRNPTAQPTNQPQQQQQTFEAKTSNNGCGSGEVKVTVELETDRFGSGKFS